MDDLLDDAVVSYFDAGLEFGVVRLFQLLPDDPAGVEWTLCEHGLHPDRVGLPLFIGVIGVSIEFFKHGQKPSVLIADILLLRFQMPLHSSLYQSYLYFRSTAAGGEQYRFPQGRRP